MSILSILFIISTGVAIAIYRLKDFNSNAPKGKMFLHRPSNKQLDFGIPISLSNHNLLIPDNRLLGGRWNIVID